MNPCSVGDYQVPCRTSRYPHNYTQGQLRLFMASLWSNLVACPPVTDDVGDPLAGRRFRERAEISYVAGPDDVSFLQVRACRCRWWAGDLLNHGLHHCRVRSASLKTTCIKMPVVNVSSYGWSCRPSSIVRTGLNFGGYGAQRIKSVQINVKILIKLNSSSDLTLFPSTYHWQGINQALGAQPNIGGGGQGHPKETLSYAPYNLLSVDR